MMRKRIVKDLLSAGSALAVSFMVGRWAIYASLRERGYEAIGGEYLMIPFVFLMAYKLFKMLIVYLEKRGRGIRKGEVEDILGYDITEEDFAEAVRYAKEKQEYIFKKDNRLDVMEHWYLVKLIEEYVRGKTFSHFTMDLCRTLRDMEKEHLFNEQGAPTDNHILADSAL